ncbi:nucleotide pyrophosphohydrolase [Microbacteriaceae bacterium]|nr:nucleotide pyrophosphohydrolase [Candidatus Saccharibacteria bacterium]
MSSITRSKPTQLVDVTGLTEELRKFAADRNWDQFHSPKNLVMALTGEIGELSEIFQWMTEAESEGAALNPETAQKVRDELADVLLYLVRLSSILNVDLNEAVQQKILLNGSKYPVAKAHGSRKKYNEI